MGIDEKGENWRCEPKSVSIRNTYKISGDVRGRNLGLGGKTRNRKSTRRIHKNDNGALKKYTRLFMEKRDGESKDGQHGTKTNVQVHTTNWKNGTGKVGENLLERDKEGDKK